VLQQVHEIRAKAAQARNLSNHITKKSVYEELVGYARQLEQQADELERQANVGTVDRPPPLHDDPSAS
jgi:hypothetical protein